MILQDFDIGSIEFSALKVDAAQEVIDNMTKSPVLQFIQNMTRFKEDGTLNALK